MGIVVHIVVGIITFTVMESVAWLSHKYIMHGFLWTWHKDHHHKKNHDSWFERNDLFFILYASLSIGSFLLWRFELFELGLPIGIGIFIYGFTYFVVHDIFIHQRFRLFRKVNNKYAAALRRAHKMHHKHLGKDNGECFGMLVIPFKYFRARKQSINSN